MKFIADNDEDVQRLAEPVLFNIMLGLEKDDYSLYSADFDEPMKTALPENRFRETRRQIESLLGTPVRKDYMGFLNRENTTHILWKARFSGTGDDVLIELTCSDQDGKIMVNGLWYK